MARWRRQGEAVGGGAGLAAAGESLQARVEVGRERVDECGLGGEDALLVSLAVQGNRLESTRVVEVAEFPDIEGDQFGQAASGEQCVRTMARSRSRQACALSSSSVVSAVISFSTAS